MIEAALLEPLLARAEADLEAALRGASMCAVSRDPAAGASTAKFLEGRWYTLRAIQRGLESAVDADPGSVLGAITADAAARTPEGPAWADYARGARSAIDDVSALIRTT